MRRVISAAVLLLLCPVAMAQHFHHAAPTDSAVSPCKKLFDPLDPATDLKAGLQAVPWEVVGTPNAKAFFNQGMTLYYGFNYEEALRNFRAAIVANNGEMAMASWGIALAAGPNINLGMDDPCRDLAQKESANAVRLAKPPAVTELQRQVINALPLRYANPADPIAEAVAYAVAMREVWKNAKNEPNVGALYAESLVELRPWALYDDCNRAAINTQEIRGVLQAAMTSTDSIGAHHYWIHTVEASDSPDDALDSANRLRTWAPLAGHLRHMPSHIYFLRGDYKQAVESNVEASDADWAQYSRVCKGEFEEYSENKKCPQLYFGHYLCHNFFFRAVSLEFLGQHGDALRQAGYSSGHAARFVANEPGLQRYMAARFMALVMDRAWNQIFVEPVPDICGKSPVKETGCHIIRSIRHWARGMAQASKAPRPDFVEANAEYVAMASDMGDIVKAGPTSWGNNTALAVLAIPRSILKARILWAEGREAEAIEHLKLAVTHEDALVYDEPPQWFPPAREALGGAFLQLDCVWASATFEEELTHHKESGRALYGLKRVFDKAGKPNPNVDARFGEAWKHADYTLTDDALWPPAKSGGTCPP